MSSERPNLIRFGVYEVDLTAGELRRNGVRVSLQEQPFQVLALLLEQPGRVVTKAELQERIWKQDTFVDFDRSLTTAVHKIRQALGDSATRPRFIETVPKRGYRFLDATGSGSRPNGTPRPRGIHTVIAATALLTIVGAWWITRQKAEAPPYTRSDTRRITADGGLTYQPAISPDGKLVAYASDRAGEGNLDIWVQQVPGGDPIRITEHPADDASPHFSPDGQTIVFHSRRDGGGIYVVSALGGGIPRRIAASGEHPRYSPDGRWVAFMPGPEGLAEELYREVAIVPASGGKPRKVVSRTRPVSNTRPVWAPDSSALLILGSQNAFSADGLEWRLVSVDGDDLGAVEGVDLRKSEGLSSRLWFNPAQWDADGYVYFAAGHPTGVDSWRVLVDPRSARLQSAPERVVSGPGEFRDLSVARGGRLAFASYSENVDIWSLAVDADRGVAEAAQPVRLTTADGDDVAPSVSLDGSRVVFRSNRSGDPEAWELNLSNGQETRLIAGSKPVINNAGDRLALTLGSSDHRDRLALLSIDGVIEKEFDFQEHYQVSGWSPNGRSILAGNGFTILHVDAESGSTTRLLAEDEPVLYQASFSPDGGWLAWLALPAELWIAPYNGPRAIARSDWVRIPDDSNTADKPRWSPNGNLLYYMSQSDGFTCIYAQRLNPETKQPEGEPFAVYHRHDSRLRIGSRGRLAMSVGRDKIVFCVTELTSNVWMVSLSD